MGKNRKILVNAACAGENPTGVGVFTKELASRLVRLRPDLFRLLAISDFTGRHPDIKIINKFISPENGATGHIFRILWSQTALAREFKRSGCELLFSTLPEAPISVKNKIVVVHDIIPVRYKKDQPRMRYYFEYIVPKILSTSRHLVFDSEFSRKDVFEYYGLNGMPYSVVPLGYDPVIFRPLEKGYVKEKYGCGSYFFYAGDMRPYKNLSGAIKAFGNSGLRDYRFIIAGRKDKRYYPALRKIAEDLGIGDKVIFTGYLPLRELPHFYNDAAAFFFPSKYEGFGLPPLEAMACGCPVITSATTSVPEVCGEAAMYIDPDNTASMSSALQAMAYDAGLRQTCSEKSLNRAEMFSWEITAERYMKLLLEALDEL